MLRRLLPKLRAYLSLRHTTWWESERFFLVLMIYGIFLGLLFTFYIPPFQKADELTHFFRTMSITQGRLICPQQNGLFHNPLPRSLEQYPYSTSIISDVDYSTRKDLNGKVDLAFQQRYACALPFVPYVPSGMLLTPLVWLQASPVFIFYAGRIINLFFGLVILAVAFKIVPTKLRLLPASVFLLPMTWHQLSSFSKDSLHISFGILTLCWLLAFLQVGKKITRWEMVAFISSLFMTIIARPQYLPLVLLVFMIPRQKIARLRTTMLKQFAKVVLAMVMAGLVGLSLKLDLYSVDASKIGATPNYEISNSDLQILYLVNHPDKFLTVPYYTFVHHGQFFFQSLVASFGSLDIFVDWFVYAIFIIILSQIIFKIQTHLQPLSHLQLGMLSSCIVGCVFAILLAMYLYSTKVGNFLVDGLQGRYFIVLVPLVLWWMAELRRRAPRAFDGFWLVMVVISVLKVTLSWYR